MRSSNILTYLLHLSTISFFFFQKQIQYISIKNDHRYLEQKKTVNCFKSYDSLKMLSLKKKNDFWHKKTRPNYFRDTITIFYVMAEYIEEKGRQ